MPILIGSADVAQRLGIQQTAVARLVKRGRLRPVHKFPGLRGPFLFDEAEVARLADERAAVAS